MKKHPQLITWLLYVIYLILLVWIILLKTEFSFDNIYRMRNTNFIPFDGTAIINGQLHYQEIYLNVLIFVPFGIYLSMLKPRWSFIKKIVPIFLTSLFFESSQYIFAIGATDITDLIGNTLGGVLGVLMYVTIQKIIKNERKTHYLFNLFASVGTVGFVLLFGLLFFINL